MQLAIYVNYRGSCEEAFQYYARHLGGRYEAIGDAFEGSSVTVPAGAEDVPGLAKNLPKTV